MPYRLLLALMLVFMFSCSKDKPGPVETQDTATGMEAPAGQAEKARAKGKSNQQEGPLPDGAFPPATGKKTLRLTPAIAFINSKMLLSAKGLELPRGVGQDRVVWYHNGAAVSTDDPASLDMAGLVAMRGDVVQAAAVTGGREIYSNYVVLSNYPPRFTQFELKVDVDNPDGGFYIDAAVEDIDGDAVSIEYEWWVNGTPAGTDPAPALKVLPGDEIRARVKAFDGVEYGDVREFKRTLFNQSPQFERIEEYFMVGGTYVYNAAARDPDGQSVTFALEGAPSGMSVDPESGQVRWAVPADYLGTVEYVITASDAVGNMSRLLMTFTVYKE